MFANASEQAEKADAIAANKPNYRPSEFQKKVKIMAMDYDGSPNGLFVQIGKIVKHFNAQKTDATDLDSDLTEIMDSFQAMTLGDPDLMTEGFPTEGESWQTEHVNRRAALAALATRRLTNKGTVLDEIGATSSAIGHVLRKLINKMNDDSETIDASAITIGPIIANAANTGNGTILTTDLLDGVTSPGSGPGGEFTAHSAYRGLTSELAFTNQTMLFEVLSDSFGGGTDEGAEVINWEGRIADVRYGYQSEGGGAIGTIIGIHSNALNQLTNGDLEDWTANVPDSWTIETGTAGTHVVEATAAANVYHGTSGLGFTGDGALATIEVKQALDVDSLVGGRGYVLTCRLRGDATIAAGNILIQLEGTGYVVATSEKIAIAAASIPTGWNLKHFFIIMPDIIPVDFTLTVQWHGTPESGKDIYFDDFALSPIAYGGGVGMAFVRGSTPWVLGDRLQYGVTNDDAGVFQKFFREAYGIQIPSENTGSETILDSLTS